MYTFDSPIFLYPENSRGEHISGQHTNYFHILLFPHSAVFLSKHSADRFLLWWLFLHRRLRSRQRGLLAFACKRLLLLPGGSLPKSVVRFYPNNLKKFFNLFVSKPFGFDSRRNSNFFPSFVALKQCVTALPASPCTGQKPVSIFDCIWSLHLFFSLSSRKYFRFCRYFSSNFRSICGKLSSSPVENSVENFANIFLSKFKDLSNFDKRQRGL